MRRDAIKHILITITGGSFSLSLHAYFYPSIIAILYIDMSRKSIIVTYVLHAMHVTLSFTYHKWVSNICLCKSISLQSRNGSIC